MNTAHVLSYPRRASGGLHGGAFHKGLLLNDKWRKVDV
jgi:hypothetical protein